MKIFKEGVLLGTGEIPLFQSINSKEKVINKWVNLSPSDLKKSAIMSNTLSNIMKINTKISISYIGNFKSSQTNEDTPTKKESALKLNTINASNKVTSKNKKANIISKRTYSVNNNNTSSLNIEYQNKSMAEAELIKNSQHSSSNKQNNEKNSQKTNLVLNCINENVHISGISILLKLESETPKKPQTKRVICANSNKQSQKDNLKKELSQNKERPKTSMKVSTDFQTQNIGGIENILTHTPNETPRQTIQQIHFEEEDSEDNEKQEEGNISSEMDDIMKEDNFDFDSPVAEMLELSGKFSAIYNDIYLEKYRFLTLVYLKKNSF